MDKKLSDLPADLAWQNVNSKNVSAAAFANNTIFAKFGKNPIVYAYPGALQAEGSQDLAELFGEWQSTFDKPAEEASSGGFHHRKIKPLKFEKYMPEKENKNDDGNGK